MRPDAIHVATEGPLGHAMRRLCLRRGLPFTTSFHTRFPDYLAERLPVPEHWTQRGDLGLATALPCSGRGGAGGDADACRRACRARLQEREAMAARRRCRAVPPARKGDLGLPRPIFLTVGRLAVEKNLEAFLELDLPGTKLVVGDGPARAALARKFPDAVFLGVAARRGAGGNLRRCRRFCVSEPHRHVRSRAAGGAGERRSGRGISRRGAARRHRRSAGRRARRGSAPRLPRRTRMLARGLPRLRACA